MWATPWRTASASTSIPPMGTTAQWRSPWPWSMPRPPCPGRSAWWRRPWAWTSRGRKLEVPSLKAKGFSREQCLKAAEEGYGSHLSTFCPVPVTREAAEKMAARMYDAYQ